MAVLNGYRTARVVRQMEGDQAFYRVKKQYSINKNTFFTMEKVIDAIEGALADCQAIPRTLYGARKDGRVGHADLNRNADVPELINALLVAGFSTDNLAVVRKPKMLYTAHHKMVWMHPSSMNDKTQGPLTPNTLWSFGELSKKDVQGRITLRDTSPATPFMALLFCESIELTSQSFIKIDSWLTFRPYLTDGGHLDPTIILTFKKTVDMVSNPQDGPVLVMLTFH